MLHGNHVPQLRVLRGVRQIAGLSGGNAWGASNHLPPLFTGRKLRLREGKKKISERTKTQASAPHPGFPLIDSMELKNQFTVNLLT